MRQNSYTPEGMTPDYSLLREYVQSAAGIERAIEEGIILESRASLCDGNHSLHVDLGNGAYGIIPFDECALDGENAKPISAISRVGKNVCFKITDRRTSAFGGTDIMLSRRAAQQECLKNYVEPLSAGDVIPARVTHIEQFGAFCDIGCGIVSLLPIDGMSVSRISHPRDRFENGQPINAVVKTPWGDDGRLILSHRELLGTWEENAAKYSVGQTVTGIVRSIEQYGVFVELTPNLAGLAEYSDELAIGDCVSVFIKSIIPQKMKLKLVIIDRAECARKTHSYDYYITSGSIKRWQYSPDGVVKLIETVF